MVSSAIALTSSTVISESLHSAHLKNSNFGKKVLQIVAVQDLIMVPLLALPEIMHSLKHGHRQQETYEELFVKLFLVWLFVKVSIRLARHLISIAYRADQANDGGELFTLSVVAYALLMATVTEKVELSLEAGALFAGIGEIGGSKLYRDCYLSRLLALSDTPDMRNTNKMK